MRVGLLLPLDIEPREGGEGNTDLMSLMLNACAWLPKKVTVGDGSERWELVPAPSECGTPPSAVASY